MINVDIQIACEHPELPTEAQFHHWINNTLAGRREEAEICVRLIDEAESAELNQTYRHKQGPTNILSFPYHDDPLEGDLAICVPVVFREAEQQKLEKNFHWAHIVIHGVLHLLGYDHEQDDEAEVMEALEEELLKRIED